MTTGYSNRQRNARIIGKTQHNIRQGTGKIDLEGFDFNAVLYDINDDKIIHFATSQQVEYPTVTDYLERHPE